MEVILREFHETATESHRWKFTDKIYKFDQLDALLANDEICEKIVHIIYLTGNKNKLSELERSLKLSEQIQFSSIDMDLVEIQHSDPLLIVQDKCIRAFEYIRSFHETVSDNSAILIEDTFLNFRALGGLPGPYVKCK